MKDGNNCYLDYNASTPLHPKVLEKFNEVTALYANPSSAHLGGNDASQEIEAAIKNIANVINCSTTEVWFTSGGTESNNWLLKGLVQPALKNGKKHFIISSIEHKSILRTAKYISESYNLDLTLLPVNADGIVGLNDLKNAIREDSYLVSVMLANNETGIIQPIKEIAQICKEKNVICHTDAVCSLGKMPIDFKALGVDSMSFSAHKLYSPKGVGVLILKENIEIDPLIHGCGQQCGMRNGTENAAGAAAFGKALELLQQGEFANQTSSEELSAVLKLGLQESFNDRVTFHGNGDRLSNTISATFEGMSADFLQTELSNHGICVSAGAAATTGDPSHVLTAMKISKEVAQSTLRISFGWGTTKEDISYFVNTISKIYETEKVLS